MRMCARSLSLSLIKKEKEKKEGDTSCMRMLLWLVCQEMGRLCDTPSFWWKQPCPIGLWSIRMWYCVAGIVIEKQPVWYLWQALEDDWKHRPPEQSYPICSKESYWHVTEHWRKWNTRHGTPRGCGSGTDQRELSPWNPSNLNSGPALQWLFVRCKWSAQYQAKAGMESVSKLHERVVLHITYLLCDLHVTCHNVAA